MACVHPGVTACLPFLTSAKSVYNIKSILNCTSGRDIWHTYSNQREWDGWALLYARIACIKANLKPSNAYVSVKGSIRFVKAIYILIPLNSQSLKNIVLVIVNYYCQCSF